MTNMQNKKIGELTRFALLLALEAIFCFTPLGSLPALGPIVMTLMMVPVVITAIFLNRRYAALMGFFAGLFSFIVWTFMPPSPMAFLFTPFYNIGNTSGNFFSLIICFVPRILGGYLSGLWADNIKKPQALSYWLSGIIGSAANTLGVTLGIALFFGSSYADLLGQPLWILIMTTIITSGIPEALLNGLICYAITTCLKRR